MADTHRLTIKGGPALGSGATVEFDGKPLRARSVSLDMGAGELNEATIVVAAADLDIDLEVAAPLITVVVEGDPDGGER